MNSLIKLRIWLLQRRALKIQAAFNKLSVEQAGDMAEAKADNRWGRYDAYLINRMGARSEFMEQHVKQIEAIANQVEQLRKKLEK